LQEGFAQVFRGIFGDIRVSTSMPKHPSALLTLPSGGETEEPVPGKAEQSRSREQAFPPSSVKFITPFKAHLQHGRRNDGRRAEMEPNPREGLIRGCRFPDVPEDSFNEAARSWENLAPQPSGCAPAEEEAA
jgi:hypothetical protein